MKALSIFRIPRSDCIMIFHLYWGREQWFFLWVSLPNIKTVPAQKKYFLDCFLLSMEKSIICDSSCFKLNELENWINVLCACINCNILFMNLIPIHSTITSAHTHIFGKIDGSMKFLLRFDVTVYLINIGIKLPCNKKQNKLGDR